MDKKEETETERVALAVVTEAYEENKDLEGYIGILTSEVHPKLGFPNPKITIPKDGVKRVLWGCECWWGLVKGDPGETVSEKQLKELQERTQESKVKATLSVLLAMALEGDKEDN